ncbi:hypothetical protein CsatB_008165 [Cannabis sativa]
MPRPGPRPYECVRRAWHSDRHQPIRGSLIKEIFRVANEIHNSSTKQNKEWQEKLPIVVLRAEEIMYSKANSEAEYMDLKTLWDRTNDAISTIIRLDESTETGEFIQPCIEAALNLGCIPRRASRSQRNCHPRCYLTPNTSEVPSVSPSLLENAATGSNLLRSSNHLSSHFRNNFSVNNISTAMFSPPPSGNNITPSNNYDQLLALSNYKPSNSFSAYPLYYGGNAPQFEQLWQDVALLPKLTSDPLKDSKLGVVKDLSCHEDASLKNTEPNMIIDTDDRQCNIGCDLSLRLGPMSVENKQPQAIADVNPREGGKFCDQLPLLDKGCSMFPPRGNACQALSSYKGVEAAVRKRKPSFDNGIDDQQFCNLKPSPPFLHLNGKMRNAGS